MEGHTLQPKAWTSNDILNAPACYEIIYIYLVDIILQREKLHILITRSNPISPDPRVEKIGRALIGAGFSVQALGWDRTGNLPEQETQDDVPVRRLPIQAAFGRGMGNLPQLLKWQWGLWRWLLQHHAEYDVIHACDFDTILPAIWMKTFFGKRVIYDIFDFYADHLRATPAQIKSIIRFIDLWAIGKADALILVDDSRVEQVSGSKPSLTTIIYNSPEDVSEKFVQSEISNAGGLRLAYIGLLQVERGLLQMLSVLKNNPGWCLDLAGFGGDEDRILAIAKNLSNVHWHGRISYQQALKLSAEADVLFATYDPKIPNHKYSSPNKIFEAMMLGKPIIVAAGTNMDRMIGEAKCGCVVPYGDIPALEKTLQTLANDPELIHKLGLNARKAYETHYNWDLMSQRLIQLYKKVVKI
jgi:glycosyltransferase involved in cell wall biosynthesis